MAAPGLALGEQHQPGLASTKRVVKVLEVSGYDRERFPGRARGWSCRSCGIAVLVAGDRVDQVIRCAVRKVWSDSRVVEMVVAHMCRGHCRANLGEEGRHHLVRRERARRFRRRPTPCVTSAVSIGGRTSKTGAASSTSAGSGVVFDGTSGCRGDPRPPLPRFGGGPSRAVARNRVDCTS